MQFYNELGLWSSHQPHLEPNLLYIISTPNITNLTNSRLNPPPSPIISLFLCFLLFETFVLIFWNSTFIDDIIPKF